MVKDPIKSRPHAPEKVKDNTHAETGTIQDDCRCKEASRMSPRQLLKLMMRDLAFWKKADKE